MKNSNNNIERRLPEKESRIKLAEERNDDEQTIINISPDIFEMLQDEYFKLRETGYDSSFNDFLRSKVRVTKACFILDVAVLIMVMTKAIPIHVFRN